MTWGKMFLSGHLYNTMLDGVLYASGFVFLVYLHHDYKVTIIYTVDPMPRRSSVIAASNPTFLTFVCPEGPGVF